MNQRNVFGRFVTPNKAKRRGLPRYDESIQLSEDIAKLRATGMALKDIAQRYGMTQQAVSYRLHDYIERNNSETAKAIIANRLIRFKRVA